MERRATSLVMRASAFASCSDGLAMPNREASALRELAAEPYPAAGASA